MNLTFMMNNILMFSDCRISYWYFEDRILETHIAGIVMTESNTLIFKYQRVFTSLVVGKMTCSDNLVQLQNYMILRLPF